MPKQCTILECDRPAFSEQWCRLHYNRFKATGDPLKTKINSVGMLTGERPICSVKDCDKPAHAQNLCSKHYQRLKFAGDPLATLKAPAGEGMKYRDGKPYYVWLYEQHNGPIPICDCEEKESFHVHHKDGNHDNNSPDNLVALSAMEHAAHHLAERNRRLSKWKGRCCVVDCPHTKGICRATLNGVESGYCPAHRFQIKRHGRITSAIPLNTHERTKAAWDTKRLKLQEQKPDGYLKHKRSSIRYSK